MADRRPDPWSPAPPESTPAAATVVRAGGSLATRIVAAVLGALLVGLGVVGVLGALGALGTPGAPGADEAGRDDPVPTSAPADGEVLRTGVAPPADLPPGELVVAGPGATTLWAVPLDGGPIRRIDGPPEVAAIDAAGYNPAGPTLAGRTVAWGDGIGLRLVLVAPGSDERVARTAPLGGVWAPVREVVPDPDGRTLWARTTPDGADVVWRLDLTALVPVGRVVLADGESRRPVGLTLVGATRSGPVVRWPGSDGGGGLWLLDPDGGPHRRLADDLPVLAVGPAHVLVAGAGNGDLSVITVVDGSTRALAVPGLRGRRPVAGAASPDGRYLALLTPRDDDGPGHLALVDLGGTTPPQLTEIEAAAARLAWLVDSSAVVTFVADGPERRRWDLVRWRPGSPAPEPLGVDVSPPVGSAPPVVLGHLLGTSAVAGPRGG